MPDDCSSLLHQVERFTCLPLADVLTPLHSKNQLTQSVEYAAQFAMLFTYGLGRPCSRASGARLGMAGYH
ncbi:hypothetical protein BDN67DRAFT_975980 [Paxillus ammoniavirescens]|nr:hypothetical protein BDN67DRAFT_975980 [Paxillus ammoniavirescens]